MPARDGWLGVVLGRQRLGRTGAFAASADRVLSAGVSPRLRRGQRARRFTARGDGAAHLVAGYGREARMEAAQRWRRSCFAAFLAGCLVFSQRQERATRTSSRARAEPSRWLSQPSRSRRRAWGCQAEGRQRGRDFRHSPWHGCKARVPAVLQGDPPIRPSLPSIPDVPAAG